MSICQIAATLIFQTYSQDDPSSPIPTKLRVLHPESTLAHSLKRMQAVTSFFDCGCRLSRWNGRFGLGVWLQRPVVSEKERERGREWKEGKADSCSAYYKTDKCTLSLWQRAVRDPEVMTAMFAPDPLRTDAKMKTLPNLGRNQCPLRKEPSISLCQGSPEQISPAPGCCNRWLLFRGRIFPFTL